METHQLESWFLAFFRSAIAMSERRIALGVHATVSTMLRALVPRYGSSGSNKAVGSRGWGFAGKKFSRREKRSVAMKHSERQAAADMQLIAIMDGGWEMPDEMVLTYIRNFLTDQRLRGLRGVSQAETE